MFKSMLMPKRRNHTPPSVMPAPPKAAERLQRVVFFLASGVPPTDSGGASRDRAGYGAAVCRI